MIDITLVILGIIVLFALLLGIRSLFNLKFCALCGAASLTWIFLLSLYYLGEINDPLFVGILMGGSVVGLMYFLEQKLPERFQMFKLPFFLTLVTAVYYVLEKNFVLKAFIILALLWVFMGILYVFRNAAKFKTLGKKIIECCRNW